MSVPERDIPKEIHKGSEQISDKVIAELNNKVETNPTASKENVAFADKQKMGASTDALVKEGKLPSLSEKNELPASPETIQAIEKFKASAGKDATPITELMAKNDRQIATVQSQISTLESGVKTTQIAMAQADVQNRQGKLAEAAQVNGTA